MSDPSFLDTAPGERNDDRRSASRESNDNMLREALLEIKGIGPWTCDMFMMFYLEKPNILPLGDLGVRKGIARYFNMTKGQGHKGSLCQKKDAERIHKRLKAYEPYQSLLTYYMWKAADTKEVYTNTDDAQRRPLTEEVPLQTVTASPKKRNATKSTNNVVTP